MISLMIEESSLSFWHAVNSKLERMKKRIYEACIGIIVSTVLNFFYYFSCLSLEFVFQKQNSWESIIIFHVGWNWVNYSSSLISLLHSNIKSILLINFTVVFAIWSVPPSWRKILLSILDNRTLLSEASK